MKSIHIYENGPVVTAILKDGKQTVSKGVAKCNPKDKYWFDVGAQIALDRALCKTTYQTLCMFLERENKPNKPDNPYRIVKQDRYEVGDRVKFVDGAPHETATISGVYNRGNGIRYTVKEDTIGSNWCGTSILGKLVPAMDVCDCDLDAVCKEPGRYCTDEKGHTSKTVPAVREVKRPAKVGEWVRVTKAPVEKFVGTIGQVVENNGQILIRHDAIWSLFADKDGKDVTSVYGCEYVVLENYDPEVME